MIYNNPSSTFAKVPAYRYSEQKGIVVTNISSYTVTLPMQSKAKISIAHTLT